MRVRVLLVILTATILCGCTTVSRVAYMYGSSALTPNSFEYRDGGKSSYYSFEVGESSKADTALFFYGATGCPSWKSVMPYYVDGLSLNAHVFALNKRFVADRSLIFFDCGKDFHAANNPPQWIGDYMEFISAQIAAMNPKPRNVVLVGVSEGALIAAKVAGLMPEVTHLAIIGSGGYSMRKSLATLKQRGAILFDVDSGWKKISADPRSIEKNWYGNRYRWWSDILDMEPLPDFLKLNIPVVVGIGEKDESVPVESALYLESKFKEAGKNNLILKVYPESDHRLSGNGISHRSEFFAELSRLLQLPTHNIAAKRDASQAARPLP